MWGSELVMSGGNGEYSSQIIVEAVSAVLLNCRTETFLTSFGTDCGCLAFLSMAVVEAMA